MQRPFWRALVWVPVFALLWFALRGIEWAAFTKVLSALTVAQVLVLLVLNILIVLLLGSRWWLILRSRGYRIGFLPAVAYRLAAFSVSYFTPGPHFGGEPLQIYLAAQKESIPTGAAAASVALDKILELSANFAFLAFGLVILLSGGLLDERTGSLSLTVALILLLLPLLYLWLLMTGTLLLTRALAVVPVLPWRWWQRIVRVAGAAEAEAAGFIASRRFTFLLAVILSGIVWAALVLEFALAIRFLGLRLDLKQVISVMTAARIAMLLPMPGGLGSLEAALMLVTQALGENVAYGAGLSLLIRVRDIGFGLFGLWLGRKLAA